MTVNDYVHYSLLLSTFYSLLLSTFYSYCFYLGYLLLLILPVFISTLCVSLLTLNSSITLSLPCISFNIDSES